MKKEYIKPEMQMHEIKAQQLLAGSAGLGYYSGQIPDDNNDEMW